MTNTIKAVSYSRFSSDQQRDESISAQQRAIAYYANQKGYELVGSYVDKARSGRSSERPEFLRMIEDAKTGAFSIVLVHKLDRFSRSAADTLHFEQELKDCGVTLVSVTEQLENTPEGALMRMVIIAINQYYSQNLGRETVKGLKENAYKALHNGGTPALGYDVDPVKKTYHINSEEAETVKEIFHLYVDKGFSYGRIIEELNAHGRHTKTGKSFGKNSIYEILHNIRYAGIYEYNKAAPRNARGKRNYHNKKSQDQIIRIEGGVPQIIDAETFKKAQERLAENKKLAGSNKAKEVYLLSGRIYCGECGSLMVGNSRTPGVGRSKYMSYRCNRRDRTRQCSNKEIRRENVEAFVLEQLEKNLFNDMIIPLLVKRINQYQMEMNSRSAQERTLTEKQLTQIDNQISNIVTAIADGMLQDVLKDKLLELHRSKSILQAKLDSISAENGLTNISEDMLRSYFSVMKRHVRDRNMPEIKRFIASYIDRVVVYGDRIDVFYQVALPDNEGSAYQFEVDIDREEVHKCWRKAE